MTIQRPIMEKSNQINVFLTRKRLSFNDLDELSQPNASQDIQTAFSTNDSFQLNTDDSWNNVSDENYLNFERQCDAAYEEEQVSFGQSSTKLPVETSCLDETSATAVPEKSSLLDKTIVYGRLEARELSTIYESTTENVNSSDASTETFSSTNLVQYGDAPAIVLVPSICSNDSFTDASTSNLDSFGQFNDTLHAVNYFMKQGEKIMEKAHSSESSSVSNQNSVVFPPKKRN